MKHMLAKIAARSVFVAMALAILMTLIGNPATAPVADATAVHTAKVITAAAAAPTYTVKSGDTLGKIAAANGTSVNRIAELNAIGNIHLIFPGQVMKLSGSTPAPATQAVSSDSAYTGKVPTWAWEKLAHCESTSNWSINTGNGYYGGLQFSPTTWDAFGGEKYADNAHQATKTQQMIIAQATIEKQGWNAWPSCSKGLTGVSYK